MLLADLYDACARGTIPSRQLMRQRRFQTCKGSTRHTEGFSIHDFMHSLPGNAGFRFWSELTSIPSRTFGQPRRPPLDGNAQAHESGNLDEIRIVGVFCMTID